MLRISHCASHKDRFFSSYWNVRFICYKSTLFMLTSSTPDARRVVHQLHDKWFVFYVSSFALLSGELQFHHWSTKPAGNKNTKLWIQHYSIFENFPSRIQSSGFETLGKVLKESQNWFYLLATFNKWFLRWFKLQFKHSKQ